MIPREPLQRANKIIISDLFVPMSLKRQKLNFSKIRNTFFFLLRYIRFSINSKSEHSTINSEEQMDHFLFGDQNTFPNIIYKPDIMTRGKTNSKKILSQIILE